MVSQIVCNLCQHRVKCWSLAEVVLLWCGAVLSFALWSQCYCLLFGASVASLRLLVLFPMGITHRVFNSICLIWLMFSILNYCFISGKFFITIIYYFYPFSVFWLIKVVIILFTDFSAIVNVFFLTVLQNILYYC